MNTVQKLTKNTLILLISQIVSIIMGSLYVMYTARYLGAENFGVLSFSLAFTGMFSIFSDMGLSQITVRDIARDKSLTEKYISNIISMEIMLSFFTLFIIIVSTNLLNFPPNKACIIYLISLSTIIGTFNKIFYSIYQAHEKMEFQSLGQIINSILLFLGSVIAIYYHYDVVVFALIYVIVSIVNLTYNIMISILAFAKPKLKFEYTFLEETLKKAIPFAMTGISINIYLWIDTILLSLFKSDIVVGWYNASYKLILMLLFIPVLLNNSLFPIMSKYYITSESSLKTTFRKLLKFMIIIGLPLGFGTLVVADKIILLIYGSKFTNSAIVLKILIWSLVLIYIRNPFERLLESINKQATVSRIFILGAVFNVLLNLMLIPKYSYIGAGIATVATDLIVLISLVISTRSLGYFLLKNEILDIIKVLVACGIMFIFLKIFSDLSLFVVIICAIIIYISSLIILQILDNNDKRLIKSVFNKGDKNEV